MQPRFPRGIVRVPRRLIVFQIGQDELPDCPARDFHRISAVMRLAKICEHPVNFVPQPGARACRSFRGHSRLYNAVQLGTLTANQLGLALG
jgi:hypothetical protein